MQRPRLNLARLPGKRYREGLRRHHFFARRLSLLMLLGILTQASCTYTQLVVSRHMAAMDPPEIPSGVLAIRNIEFTSTPNGPLYLDVYRKERVGEGLRPVVLFVFGGGWVVGDRNQVQALDLLRLVEHGFIVVTSDYRYSTEAIFPAQINDVKAALRWIHANAVDQGLDPDRVAILGPSSGGHLAALAGTSGGVTSLDGDLRDWTPTERELSTSVQAVVDFFGPTDLRVYREQHRANGLGNNKRLWFLDLLVGGPVAERPDLVQMLNPIRYIDAGDPPFLIIAGDRDPVVPIQQSEMLDDALRRVGVDVTFIRIEGGDHGESPEYRSDWLFERIVAFLDRSLELER